MRIPNRKLTPFEDDLIEDVHVAVYRRDYSDQANKARVRLEEAEKALHAATKALYTDPRYIARSRVAEQKLESLRRDAERWAEWQQEGEELEEPLRQAQQAYEEAFEHASDLDTEARFACHETFLLLGLRLGLKANSRHIAEVALKALKDPTAWLRFFAETASDEAADRLAERLIRRYYNEPQEDDKAH